MCRFITDSQKKSHVEDGEDSEVKREEFRHPRNCLLNFATDFYKLCSGKLNEINKVWPTSARRLPANRTNKS